MTAARPGAGHRQRGGESVLAVLAIGVIALVLLVYWLRRRKRQGKPTLLDPDLFRSKVFESGVTGQMLQQIALGGTMIVLPIYLQMVLEYNALKAGLSLAPRSPLASLTWQPRRVGTFLMAGGAQVTLNRAGLVSAL